MLIKQVIDYGKAQRAEIQVDDEVIEINGRNVEHLYHTEALVAVKKATDCLTLKIKRYAQVKYCSKSVSDGNL